MNFFLQRGGYPSEEVRSDLAAIQFIQHFVPSAFVKLAGDVAHASVVITLDEAADAFQFLSDRVFFA